MNFPRDAWVAACPFCNEGANKPCRTLKTKRVTDTHAVRFEASMTLRRALSAL